MAVAAATVLLSAAGLPGARASHAADPAGAPGAGHVKFYHGISAPGAITAGPDGALWFTISHFNDEAIGRITTTGKVTIYPAPLFSAPLGITAGPDKALWFTCNGNNSIGRITTSVTP